MTNDIDSSQSLTVLLVDDSSSERKLNVLMLKKMGNKVIEAESGEDAIEILIDHSLEIDLILLDVLMTGIDGYETARIIRDIEKSQKEEWHPIIFISGKNTPDEIALGISSGGDDYLTKPVNSIILQAKIFSMRRISSMRRKLLSIQHQLEVLASTDELTKIPNRRDFMDKLETEISRARRYHHSFSVAYIDIDHFKRFNDNYGHDTGDKVLQAVSATLAQSLRHEDHIGRLGGEEFGIILSGINIDQSIKSCERYRKLIETFNFESNSEVLRITASFGLAEFDFSKDDAQTILARADKALYNAKVDGRNRLVFLK